MPGEGENEFWEQNEQEEKVMSVNNTELAPNYREGSEWQVWLVG